MNRSSIEREANRQHIDWLEESKAMFLAPTSVGPCMVNASRRHKRSQEKWDIKNSPRIQFKVERYVDLIYQAAVTEVDKLS